MGFRKSHTKNMIHSHRRIPPSCPHHSAFLPTPHLPLPQRSIYGTEDMRDLEFSLCITPIAEEVAAEEDLRRSGLPNPPSAASSSEARSLSSEAATPSAAASEAVSPGQSFTAKAALMLWLWLERECAG